jgi:dihydroorotate dehydrogenase (fumarate)
MDLSTTYMGIKLRNPLVASPSPLSHTLDGVRRLADGGAAAVVLHSLFEEDLLSQAEHQIALAEAGSESSPESLSFFPEIPGADAEPRRYLSLLERSAATVGVPVVASLNGASPGSWSRYARQMQDAGAAGIELNLYASPAGPATAARTVEETHLEILGLVKAAVALPVAVKMSPYYSSVGEMAARLADAGADALVLFNRFMHPDIDTDALSLVPGIGLSSPPEARLPRTWVALLRPSLSASLAISTGTHSSSDLVKGLLAGADVVMATSVLLNHGPGHSEVLLEGLSAWMEARGYANVKQFRGLLASGRNVPSRERVRYVEALRAANAVQAGTW